MLLYKYDANINHFDLLRKNKYIKMNYFNKI